VLTNVLLNARVVGHEGGLELLVDLSPGVQPDKIFAVKVDHPGSLFPEEHFPPGGEFHVKFLATNLLPERLRLLLQ
jgi:hypothetical protein